MILFFSFFYYTEPVFFILFITDLDSLYSGDETLDFGKASISDVKPAVFVKHTPGNFDYRGTTAIYTQDDESTPLFMLHHSSGEYFNSRF